MECRVIWSINKNINNYITCVTQAGSLLPTVPRCSTGIDRFNETITQGRDGSQFLVLQINWNSQENKLSTTILAPCVHVDWVSVFMWPPSSDETFSDFSTGTTERAAPMSGEPAAQFSWRPPAPGTTRHPHLRLYSWFLGWAVARCRSLSSTGCSSRRCSQSPRRPLHRPSGCLQAGSGSCCWALVFQRSFRRGSLGWTTGSSLYRQYVNM